MGVNRSDSSSCRRKFLVTGASGLTFGLAGCSGIIGSGVDEDSEDNSIEETDTEKTDTTDEGEKILREVKASIPSLNKIEIRINSKKTLKSLKVDISGPSSSTLSLDDFELDPEYDNVLSKEVYVATYVIKSTGEYNITVLEATDGDVNAVAGQKTSIVIEKQNLVQIGPRQEPDLSRHNTPSAPEADWVVAKDGSGDYDTVAKAMEIIKSGDVIKLKSGTYTVSEGGFGALVGDGKGDTTINMDTRDIESDFSVFDATVTGGGVIVNALSKFNNCNVEVGIRSYSGVTPSAEIKAVNSNFNSVVEAEGLTAKGCEFADVRLVIAGYNFTDCIFNARFEVTRSSPGKVNRCVFNKTPSLGNTKATNTVFTSGAIGGSRFENCRFEPGVGGSGAVAIQSGAGLLRYSIVHGKIAGKTPDIRGSRINNIIGNIIDPKPDELVVVSNTTGNNYGSQIAKTLKYNAFIKCKLKTTKLEGGSERMSADYNYYDTFDGNDENGDGIIDKPYPLPGDADVVDRNPLSSEDIKMYLQQR